MLTGVPSVEFAGTSMIRPPSTVKMVPNTARGHVRITPAIRPIAVPPINHCHHCPTSGGTKRVCRAMKRDAIRAPARIRLIGWLPKMSRSLSNMESVFIHSPTSAVMLRRALAPIAWNALLDIILFLVRIF